MNITSHFNNNSTSWKCAEMINYNLNVPAARLHVISVRWRGRSRQALRSRLQRPSCWPAMARCCWAGWSGAWGRRRKGGSPGHYYPRTGRRNGPLLRLRKEGKTNVVSNYFADHSSCQLFTWKNFAFNLWKKNTKIFLKWFCNNDSHKFLIILKFKFIQQ